MNSDLFCHFSFILIIAFIQREGSLSHDTRHYFIHMRMKWKVNSPELNKYQNYSLTESFFAEKPTQAKLHSALILRQLDTL